jgi:hypothetical protein
VKGVDHGIGAVPLSLGGNGVDQQPGEQSAGHREQDDQPLSHARADRRKNLLAAGARGIIMGQAAEQHGVGKVQRPGEDQSPQARHDADRHAVEKPADQIVRLHIR